ncbi:MAG: hypothetical protein MUC59_10750, partial [Saprospiraceae bacterium]|nr:hypothetical protein [Saprospiraceae bacterium]
QPAVKTAGYKMIDVQQDVAPKLTTLNFELPPNFCQAQAPAIACDSPATHQTCPAVTKKSPALA